jgi:hypothetical protein
MAADMVLKERRFGWAWLAKLLGLLEVDFGQYKNISCSIIGIPSEANVSFCQALVSLLRLTCVRSRMYRSSCSLHLHF